MSSLRQDGILAVFHYVPLHTSPMGMTMGYRPGDLPVTEDVSSRLLRLPLPRLDLGRSQILPVQTQSKWRERISNAPCKSRRRGTSLTWSASSVAARL